MLSPFPVSPTFDIIYRIYRCYNVPISVVQDIPTGLSLVDNRGIQYGPASCGPLQDKEPRIIRHNYYHCLSKKVQYLAAISPFSMSTYCS